MNEGNNGKLWVIGILVALIAGIYFGGNYLVNKVTDRVIQKLQKEYSPSPYGPGLDPDKIDPDALKRPVQK
jgi:hypothetical protein